ncbi:hypothetical protein RhiirA5_383026 [Rhizophagus irregularis]|uniref:C2H2-type domain-containing protein n=1 Tax=Rhizophagus irregularis TaxID=588596 RepID=A0A2N0NYK6_9GLOM|nr:hypothetical protein RhiirA5_383026 [Rhizophagus irregularis]CAB5191228.1 unnamed protein product [Rhizophagus irregularis]
MTAKLFEYNMSFMAPFGTLNFDNYDYMDSESDCDSTSYYADREYSDDDLEDSERDDISDVYIKEEVIDTSNDNIGSYDNFSERSIEDDLYARNSFPNYDFDMVDNNNSDIDIYDEPVIIKMENSLPFGSEKQDSNFVDHYIGTIQAQNPNSELSDETVSIKMETSGDETVCVKTDSREFFNGLEDDLPDNTINKIKIRSCKYSNCEKGDVHENDRPVEDLCDNTLHKVKIRPCEYSNCKKRDVHENEQSVEIKIESFEDLKSLEEFLRYDEAVRAKMSSNEPFSESIIKMEQTEYCPSFDSLEEFLRYDETIRAKMESCGRSFYDEERNLSSNNQTVHVKMEPYEPFYGEERNLDDNNQTVHVKMQSYEPFYGNERNNNSVHIKMEPYEPFYGAERNLTLRDNNQTVNIKVEPYEPISNDRYLSDNYRAKIDLTKQKEFQDSLEEFLRYDENIGVEMEPYGSFHNVNVDSTEKELREFFNNEEYLSDDSYESSNGDGKIFNENLRDGATVNIKSDKLIRSEELNIDDSILSYVNVESSDNCADFVDEQMNEYNLPDYNSGNAYSGFEGNNNIANKMMDNFETNHHFWNYVPFFDIYSTASRQSSKRKFENDIYKEQYSRDLLSTTKQNAYKTSLNETTGESSQKRYRLAYRMNERPYKCNCGKLFRKSASLNRHQNLVHHKH